MQENNRQEYHDKMIEAFIDKPSETLWYQNSFKKFTINGVDKLQWNWSWWAFGGGFLYLLYRKQYLPAIILFFASFMLSIIPFVSLILMVLSGGYASYFVYKGYKTKLQEIESAIDDEETRLTTMREIGGYNQWVVWVYSIFVLIIIAFFSTIFIPIILQ